MGGWLRLAQHPCDDDEDRQYDQCAEQDWHYSRVLLEIAARYLPLVYIIRIRPVLSRVLDKVAVSIAGYGRTICRRHDVWDDREDQHQHDHGDRN